MKQSKTTLKELTAAYRAVLRHAVLCNAIALGLIVATPARAVDVSTASDLLTELQAGSEITVTGNIDGISGVPTISGKTNSLNLNGQTLSGGTEGNSGYMFTGGSLTLTGGGIISGLNNPDADPSSVNGGEYGALNVNGNGTLTMTGGDWTFSGNHGGLGALNTTNANLSANVNTITFSGNSSDTQGGGLRNDISNAAYTGNSSVIEANEIVFSGNTIGSDAVVGSGAGAMNSRGTLELLGATNTFENNSMNATVASGRMYKVGGGAVANQSGENSGTLFHATMVIGKEDGSSANTFTGNYSSTNGGAIMNRAVDTDGNAYLTINGTTIFSNNIADVNGGAIYNVQHDGRTAQLNLNNGEYTFTGNQASGTSDYWGRGGAIYNSGVMNVSNATFGGADAALGNTAEQGGAIYNAGNATVSGAFENNSAQYGGAVLNAGTLTINGDFDSNSSTKSGGAIYNAGTVTVNGTFENNSSLYGGAIINAGTATVTESTFSLNEATDGAAIYIQGNTTITDSSFSSNEAQRVGGALSVAGDGLINITGAQFTSNSTTNGEETNSDGGAIGQFDGSSATINITDSYFTSNKANDVGGAVTSDRALNVTGSHFIGNQMNGTWMGTTLDDSNEGGGAIFLYDQSVATITDTEFTGNHSGTWGGAIATRGVRDTGTAGVTSTLSITGSTFAENTATVGGAIANSLNSATITDTNFTDNTASDKGGAIYNKGTLTVAANEADVTFTGNTANGEANDIYNIGTLTLNAASGHSISLAGGITGALESIASNIVNITGAGNVSVDNTLINQTVNNSGNLSLNADLTGTTITNAEGSTITLARDIAFEGGENTLDGYNGELTNDITVADGAALTINNATFASGDGDLVNEQGGVLRINDSLVGVNVTNHGTLISDPTTYSNTVTNTGIASFDDDTFTGTAELANTGTVSLANGVTFESGATITGAGVTNLTGGYTHFNDTANANTINVVSGANFDGLVIGGTINTQNGMIDAIAGSIQDADVALDVDTNSLTTDTFADASNSTIKSLNVFGAYGNSGTATIAMAPGMSLADDAVINGGYYTSVTANGGNIVFGDKLMNTSGLYAQLGSWSGDIIGTSSTYDSETNSYTNTGTTVGAALAALETAVNGKQDTITNTATIAADGTGFSVVAGSIGATQLAANSVASSNIIDGTIVNDDIATGTITTDRLASQNVSQFTNDAGYQNATQVSDAISSALANNGNAYQTANDIAETLGAYSTTEQMNTAIENALANGTDAYQTASSVAETLEAYSTTTEMNAAIASNAQNATYTSGNHESGTIGAALDTLTSDVATLNSTVEDLASDVATNTAAIAALTTGENSVANQIANNAQNATYDASNVTEGSIGAAISQNTTDIAEINSVLGTVHGLVESADATTTVNGDDYHGNLAVGTTVEDHLVALDSAIGDMRGFGSNNIATNTESVAANLTALDGAIGTTNTGTHVAATNSVGQNLNSLDTALADAESDIDTLNDQMEVINGDENTTGSMRNIAKSYFDLVTAQDSALTLSQANAYTDERIEKLDKNMSSGIASAVALSSVAVSDVRRGEVSVGAGYGYFNGQSAGAFGAAMGISNRWSVNAGAGISGYDVSFRAGTNYKFKLF